MKQMTIIPEFTNDYDNYSCNRLAAGLYHISH